MNRRSLLGLLGLAPAAAALRLPAEAAPLRPVAAGLSGADLHIAAGSIRAERIQCGTIGAAEVHHSRLHPRLLETELHPSRVSLQDHLVANLSFGC